MTVPIRTFVALGLAVGMLGAGYVFAPQTGAATVAVAPAPTSAPLPSAAARPPTAKPTALVGSRPPVPLVTRTHTTYFVPKEAEGPVQISSTSGGWSSTGLPTAEMPGAETDGGLPPSSDARTGDDRQARAAIELDGYKNVRALEKGSDGIWRGRAMRGRTEIAVRVDASGSVSAD